MQPSKHIAFTAGGFHTHPSELLLCAQFCQVLCLEDRDVEEVIWSEHTAVLPSSLACTVRHTSFLNFLTAHLLRSIFDHIMLTESSCSIIATLTGNYCPLLDSSCFIAPWQNLICYAWATFMAELHASINQLGSPSCSLTHHALSLRFHCSHFTRERFFVMSQLIRNRRETGKSLTSFLGNLPVQKSQAAHISKNGHVFPA